MERTSHFRPAVRRRRLFKLGAAGAAVLGLTYGTARLLRAPAGAVPGTPVALSARRFTTVTALVAALYPGEEGGLPPGVDLGVPQRVDQELYFAAPHVRDQVDLALDVLEYGGPLLGWWGRFSRLPLARRRSGFTGLFQHPLGLVRQLAAATSQLVQVFYYAQPETWAAIGYPGPFLDRKPPLSEAYYAERVATAGTGARSEGTDG